jgi:hypothetical protein
MLIEIDLDFSGEEEQWSGLISRDPRELAARRVS